MTLCVQDWQKFVDGINEAVAFINNETSSDMQHKVEAFEEDNLDSTYSSSDEIKIDIDF